MRGKKLLKMSAIAAAVAVVLLLLFVAVFVFNPLEGSLRDMRDVVPRDVDFFLRKVDLASDFAPDAFPEPHFWRELRQQPAWAQRVVPGPTYRALDGRGQVARALEEVREQVRQVRDQSRGLLDPLADALGVEVEVAGRFGAPAQGGTKWCAYARVRWPVRALWGCLRYGFAQERLRRGGIAVRADDDLFAIEPAGGPALWAARWLDCAMVGNDRALVQRSYELAAGIGDPDSFGGSASYRDGVERRVQEWEQNTELRANALEFFVRTDRLLALPSVTFDDRWPDRNHPTDMNSRVLARFFNLQSWLSLSGALVFEEAALSLLADVELNQNKHERFQQQFFQTESQPRSEWLASFLRMVPASACACAALRMPAGEFLDEMFASLTQAEQDLVNDGLRSTGQFQTARELIQKLGPNLLDRTGFVFRKNTPDAEIEVADTSPVPQAAWVFWMRKENRPQIAELVDLITRYREPLGFTNAYDLSLGLAGRGVGGDAAREFTNPQIPGTGSIATLIYPPFFVVSNSGPFIRELILTLVAPEQSPSILTREDFQEYERDLPDAVNGFVYLQGPEFRRVLEEYLADIDRATSLPDPAWAIERRSAAELEVFRRKYGQYGSLAALPPEVKATFDEEVDRELDDMWRRERSNYSSEARGAVHEVIGLCDLLRSAYFQVVLEPRHLRLAGRTLAAFR